MSRTPARTADLPSDVWDRLDALVERFEASWRHGQRPAIDELLPADDTERRAALVELAHVELELRLRAGEDARADAYLERYPELNEGGVAEALHAAELALRPSRPGAADETPPDGGRVGLAAEPANALRALALTQPAGAPPDVPGYDILGELGRGGMGVVYRARQVSLNRLVALKMVLADGGAAREERARFRAEAEAVARLQHPHIVQIHEVGEAGGRPFFSLELVEGGNLADRLGGTPLPAPRAAALVETLARAVAYAHQAGVVHRDLKPANVLLAADGTPKVTDFGLAKRLDAGPGLTRTGAILGTPSYMAPEQAGGRPERVGPAADIYALGAILYECLTGRPPFRAETALETLEQMRTQDPVPPRRLQPKVPRDLETVCLQCLHKQPPRRYAGALDLAEDLGRFGRGEPIRARPASAGELAWKWAKRRPAVAALIGLAAAVLMAAAAGVAYHNRRLREEVIIAQAAQSAAVTSAETARAAERKADASARTALKTLDRLVFQVQEKLRSTPATRQLRQGLLETALDGLREVAGAGDAATPDVLRAAAHLQMGDIHWQLGRVPEALAEQQRCRDTAAALLAADPGNADARHYEALALHRLGSYNLKRGNTALARQLMQQAVDHTEAWCAAAPADARARADRAQSYRHLGFACQWVADLPAAEAAYRRLQALAQAWLDEAPGDREARFALTVVYGSLAQIAEDRGDLTAARDLHGRSLAVSEALAAEEPANDQYRRSLMVDRFNLGTICRRLGDLSAARGHLDAALATARARAAADPENVPCQIDLVDGLRGRGALECDELQFAAAAPYFEEGLAVLQRLDAAGKLADTPMFQKEWMDEFRHHVEICRLVPRVMADEAVLWRQPPRLACPLALDRIGLLLRDGRPADAVATGEALGRFTPADADGWFRLGRTCARAAGVLGRRAGPAAEPVVGRLIQSSLDGYRRALELGYPYFNEEKLKTDPDLEPLRRHPGFPALIEQLRKRRHSP